MGVARDLDLDSQPIAADHTAWRMQQVDVADVPFRVERLLDGERSLVASVGQDGTAGALLETEREPRFPAFGLGFSHRRACVCRTVQPADQERAMVVRVRITPVVPIVVETPLVGAPRIEPVVRAIPGVGV